MGTVELVKLSPKSQNLRFQAGVDGFQLGNPAISLDYLRSETLWLVSGSVWTVVRIIGRCILVMMTAVRRGNAAALAGTQCRFLAS
jgi:hypothetical protein